jgi:hypothetical protein
MRIVLVIAGIVVLLVGALIQFVPLAPQPVNPISTYGGTPFETFSVGGFSITGSITVSISWTASSPVTFIAAVCPSGCHSANVSSLSDITTQSGKSGSLTLSQPNGGEIILVALSNTSTGVNPTVITVWATEAAVVLFAGVAVVIAGVVWRSPRRAVPTAGAAVSPSPAEVSSNPPSPGPPR